MRMKCKDKKCKTCPSVCDGDWVSSNSMPVCKMHGVIYMLICSECNVKYIGQTGTAFNLRINNHRSLCNKKSNNDIQSKYEFEHFKIHSFKKVKINILDIVPDKLRRLELENYYIIKYETAYPFGLNDRINNESVTSIKNNKCIYKNIFESQYHMSNSRQTNRIRSKNKLNVFVNFPWFLGEINEVALKQKDLIKYIKSKILGLKRSKCKALVKLVIDYKFKYNQVKDLICDLLKFKLKCEKLELESGKFDSYLVIDFSHKYLNLINISQLLHDPNLIKTFPSKVTYPKISYKYSPTIGSTIFNYSKFSKDIRIENIDNYPCVCENSRFKDVFHNHIVTGSLDIIDNEEIKNIFKFGSNYRLVPKLNVNKIMEDINNKLNNYISSMSYKLKLHFGHFLEWKTQFVHAIRNKMSVTPNCYPVTINFNQFKSKVKELQNKFVIVPVDKASNNFGFICKRYYAQILMNEIDSSNTFEPTNVSPSDIKNSNINFLKNYKIMPTNFNIPFMYATPKFHKNPTKFRFITSSVKCVSKDISIIFNLILDNLMHKVETESGNNWIIKNNDKVLESIKKCNDNYQSVPGNFMVATFDFSTLYTTLPHDDLIYRIVALFNKYFESNVEVIYNNNKLVFDKVDCVNILKFCVDNSYIAFNDHLYKQKVGIPMGANFSPNLANLYLHFYESKFLDKNHEQGRIRYKYTFRFIDDLLSVNNRDINFDINAIYPRALEVSSTNELPHKSCSFLDLDVNISEDKFVTKVYDKRRDFNFEILGLPAFSSNIPSNLTYNVLCSQMCRYARICSFGHDFISNCQLLVNKMLSNEVPSYLIKKYIYKFENSKSNTVSKFNFEVSIISLLMF